LGRNERAVSKGSSAEEQISKVLINLNAVELEQIVKLNVVAANDKIVGEVKQSLAVRFKDHSIKPAVSYVVGNLRDPNALVGIDVVAMHPRDDSGAVGHSIASFEPHAWSSTLPPGPKVYVSGQAEKGKDIAEMTRRTMESLLATLKHMGLASQDIVQIRSFIGPMTAVDEAEGEIAKFFRGSAPALVFVEWTTSPSIEIELLASGNRAKVEMDDTVEFITPPGIADSPVFSRVARIAAGPSIYISGLYGTSSRNGAAETGEIFAQLGKLLEKTGSDFRHLVKATYYVSTDEASAKLNELRPNTMTRNVPLRPRKHPSRAPALRGKH